MQTKPIAIPKVRTTDEEADWWESREGKHAATEIMRRGIAAGAAKRLRLPLKTVTMRLPQSDIEAAKDIAFRKGIPYQTYIKMLLHEAIEKERRSA